MNIKDLRKKQVIELCKSLLEDYETFLNEEEINIIRLVFNGLNGDLSLETIEQQMLPIVKKIWDMELASDNYVVVSWNKYAKPKEKSPVTFATISVKDNIVSFCNLSEGMKYKISFEAILGAHYKDGATLIEGLDKKGDFTIGSFDDKVINSYNGATKLITPMQLIKENDNDYLSKHNELILDTSLIIELGPFELPYNK